jgi:hypothetical protein
MIRTSFDKLFILFHSIHSSLHWNVTVQYLLPFSLLRPCFPVVFIVSYKLFLRLSLLFYRYAQPVCSDMTTSIADIRFIRLQAISELMQTAGHRLKSYQYPMSFQFLGKVVDAFTGPPEYRQGVCPCQRLYQAFKAQINIGVVIRSIFPTPVTFPDSIHGAIQFLQLCVNNDSGKAYCPCFCGNPPIFVLPVHRDMFSLNDSTLVMVFLFPFCGYIILLCLMCSSFFKKTLNDND